MALFLSRMRAYLSRLSAGVVKKQVSQRVLGLAIMLFVMGLSYGAVAIVLDALGIGMGKSSVYRAVQAVSGCERSIGWWIKERYRSRRGYKREQSTLNVRRLIAFFGNQISRGLDLASLIA